MAGGGGGGGGGSTGFVPVAERAHIPVFTGPDVLFAVQVNPGDVIRIIHGRLASRSPSCQDTLVLEKRDGWFDHLPIATPSTVYAGRLDYAFTGRLATENFARVGMAPYRPEGQPQWWTDTVHTVSLGLHMEPALFTEAQANDMQAYFDSIRGGQEPEPQGVDEVGMEERVLHSLIKQAMPWGGQSLSYHQDSRV